MSTAGTAETLALVLRDAAATLRKSGAGSPDLDARVLAAHALEVDSADLIAASREPLDPSAAIRLQSLIRRRAAGEPVARILGRREFWGLEFALNDATLIPRPDSETLVAAALELLERGPGRDAALRIADLGTGSGCLLVALLTELPASTGVGVDVSSQALDAASANARRHGLGGRAAFVAGSWADALSGADVIVANPPYIPGEAIDSLAPEVAEYEPRIALDGGPDGLSAYQALLPSAQGALARGGVVLVEVAEGRAEAVGRLVELAGLMRCGSWRDLAGRPRVIAGRQPG